MPSGKKAGRSIAFGNVGSEEKSVWTDCGQMSGNRKPASLFFFSNHTISHPFSCPPLLLPDAKSLDLGQFISAFMDKRLSFHVSEACICFLENHAIGYLLT